ncbi:hypothetical protein ACFV3R_34345 [Streptomyces sp. NPDC059740]|uniref:hypothetical protein n=1 Tax=Streptomyces sp. NPDC059740 TaxID=3346926 RepID=UPI0036567884
MSGKIKIRVFVAIIAIVTVLAFVQGFMSAGVDRVILLVLAFMGLGSMVMLGIASSVAKGKGGKGR